MPSGYESNAQAMEAVVDLARGRCTLVAEGAGGLGYQQAQMKEALDQQRALEQIHQGGINGFAYLSKLLHLSLFEQHCLRLALAVEVDSQLEGLYASLQDQVLRLPTLALCLETFTLELTLRAELLTQWKGRKDMLALLFDQGLGVVGQQSDLTVGLKLASRVVSFCFEPEAVSSEFQGGLKLYFPKSVAQMPLLVNGELAQTLSQFIQRKSDNSLRIYHLHGEVGVGKVYLAHHVASRLDRVLQVFHLPAVFQQQNWTEQVRKICREVVMCHGLVGFTGMDLLVKEEAFSQEDGTVSQGGLIDRQGCLQALLLGLAPLCERVFFFSACPWDSGLDTGEYQVVAVPLQLPDGLERMALMEHYFAPMEMESAICFEALASKFTLNAGQIAKAAKAAQQQLDWTGDRVVSNALIHRVCREQLAHGMGTMATLVSGLYQWEDLILPPKQKRQLQSACAQVEHRHQVYYTWGFDKKRAYGKGLSMLFTGPPGTGKTMAAQVVANRLHLDLYKVDMSSVLSKYIGETEKQLGKVFDEVKKSQSILFFDEADAMFGKRSETKDAHDKYANVQTSYLLQKMEEYDGIVVLASNYLENFDEAFKRRITYIIDFTLPDVAHRLQIWQSVLPPELPLDPDMDVEFLARSFDLSGSSIKNIALSAAFMAADSGTKMTMTHVLLATREEQHKAGKLLQRDDFGEYYPQIELYL